MWTNRGFVRAVSLEFCFGKVAKGREHFGEIVLRYLGVKVRNLQRDGTGCRGSTAICSGSGLFCVVCEVFLCLRGFDHYGEPQL